MRRISSRHSRSLKFLLLALLSSLLCLLPVLTVASEAEPQQLEQQARDRYQAGDATAAIPLLQAAIRQYEAQADELGQAIAWSNLALGYQQISQWPQANEAIATSLRLLPADASASVAAQILNIQGGLNLAQGQAATAIDAWDQAARLASGNVEQQAQIDLNRAQALQALGQYRRAIEQLNDLSQRLGEQSSALHATVLRSLAEAQIVSGDLGKARDAIDRSLTMATALQQPEAVAMAQLSLGNLTRAEALTSLSTADLTLSEALIPSAPRSRVQQQAIARFEQQIQTALEFYQQAAQQSATRLQAELQQFRLLVEVDRHPQAQALFASLLTQLRQLPPSHAAIYRQINFAESVIDAPEIDETAAIENLLTTVATQAQQIQDDRAESYAWGTLGRWYEQQQQWTAAIAATESALRQAQTIAAADVAYRWQWQMGRLRLKVGDRDRAIAAYTEAVTTLQQLRQDLAAMNRDVQFSFRDRVEPVYRQLVELLLQPDVRGAVPLGNLRQARDVIEALQIAELDNFFREACLDTAFQLDRLVDQDSQRAAIFYPIVLPERLEVIVKLPQQPLQHYSTIVSQAEVDRTVTAMLAELKRPYASTNPQSAQQLYRWLLQPAETLLGSNSIDTLVFVLDGTLRNIPIAALHTGTQYVVEQYAIALAPGLQLRDPQPLDLRSLKVLVAGLSEARSDFPALSYVEREVEQIETDLPSEVLLNQTFTRDNLQKLLDDEAFSIVHIATHGQFSSNASDTFILAWDNPIDVNELSRLLQTRSLTTSPPIELLVLSACRTAAGDRRAALGLAGVAVRAGARSTIASLWSLDDDSGAAMMQAFYQELQQPQMSKAEALRRAQRSLLADPRYAAPRFWAPYVLLGNWL